MPPLTRAETSGYTETSLHADVLAFLAGLEHPHLFRGSFGASPEGRELPLLVLSARGVRTPAEARAAGLPVVLVINGIHAGEVEGKEASMMLVRDLLAGRHQGLLEKITLVVVPLFNPDGNDRLDPKNRALDVAHFSGQIGPAKVGTRVNASGVNLNRDYMRQESAEMRQLQAGVCQPWGPDLTIDCHATNGSVHRFHLTYDTPHTVESGRPEPIRFMREQFCPELTRRVRAGSGRETFFYGNFVEDEGGQGEGWMTYTHHPRFGSNYRGLTGRCDLLFEAYSYIPYEERVKTTYQLLEEALLLAAERGEALTRVVAESRTPLERVAVRYRLEAEAEPARVLTRAPRALDGAPTEVVLPHLARFVGAVAVDRPWAYAVPEAVGRHLARHGLAARPLSAAVEALVEAPVIEGVSETDSRGILEAPGEVRLEARFERRTQTLPAGAWLVETAQPLGAIAVYLCEAESDDGLVATGLLAKPARGDRYPALRVLEPVRAGCAGPAAAGSGRGGPPGAGPGRGAAGAGRGGPPGAGPGRGAAGGREGPTGAALRAAGGGGRGAGGARLGAGRRAHVDRLAALNHPAHVADHDLDVGARIALDRDEVGEVAGRDAAELFVFADAARGLERRGAQRLHRGHAGPDQPGEFARVLAAHREHGVRAHGDRDPAAERAGGRGEVLLEEGIERAGVFGREAKALGVLAVEAVVVDGRDVDRLAPHHFVEGGVVEALGVLERVGARPHRVGGGLGVVGVNGDVLAEAVALVDRGA